ncbi:hypothetical protein T05_14155 [Trichinella murrelli]|uniref:Uncharacterized protein n=1 Tax=Trichinella murrelli TaxID=144512 RepID=A0A0V0U1X4_9BILA|nr:hypothetical protein T05_14155 [Trichinella murrelli]
MSSGMPLKYTRHVSICQCKNREGGQKKMSAWEPKK